MKKIRSGNDIQITWNVYGKNGSSVVPYDVTGAEVWLVNALKESVPFEYTITSNTVTGTYYGKDQHTMGKYRLLLVKNADEEGMVTLDATDAFILTCVSKFGVVEGNDEGVVETATVELESQTNITVGGGGDMSDYYTKAETNILLAGKQDSLVSGTNIKTINNESILGSGNITIQGGGDFIFSTPLYMQDSSSGTEVFLKGGNNTIISGIVESGDDEGWSHAGNSALPTIDAVKSKVDLKADANNVYTKTQTNNLLATKSPIIQLNGYNLSETGINKLDMSTFTYVEHLGTDNHIYLGVYNDISAGGNLLRTYIMGQVESLQQCYTIFEESGNSAVPTCGLLHRVIYSKKETDNLLTGKQDSLVSGTNIKTVNGNSILGSGDIVTPNTTYSTVPDTALVMNSDNEFYLSTDDEGPIERVFDFANNGEDEWENLGDSTGSGSNVNGDLQLATLKYTAYNTMPDFEVAEYDNEGGTLKINHTYCISISEDSQFEYVFDTSIFDAKKVNKIGYVNIILCLDTTGLQGPQIAFSLPQNSNNTVLYMSGSKDFLNNFDDTGFDIDASFQGERQFNIMIMYNSYWHEMYVNIAEIDL